MNLKTLTARERSQTQKPACCRISPTCNSLKIRHNGMVTEVRIVAAFKVAGDMTAKSHQRTFRTDVNALYLEMGDGYAGVPTVNTCALFYSM